MDTEKFNKLDTKLDKIVENLGRIDVTLAAQHVSLKEHMRRTELLEESMEPVKTHVAMMHGALKFIGLLGVLAAIIEAILTGFRHL